MFIDSHCHLDKIDLAPYQNDFALFMDDVKTHKIDHLLCIAITLEAYPAMAKLVAPYSNISLSVGVHPDEQNCTDPTVAQLLEFATDPKVIAIGETGLDYFRTTGDVGWQKSRFKNHIEAARQLQKPLIIHTRAAGQDSLDILEQQGAAEVGGIIHCFTEDWDYASRAMDLGFYISFSGIVTFKNAKQIQEVARKIPADRFLIETDAPYLAPVPMRGKSNYPTYVPYVAQHLATLRGVEVGDIAQQSSDNFRRLFAKSLAG